MVESTSIIIKCGYLSQERLSEKYIGMKTWTMGIWFAFGDMKQIQGNCYSCHSNQISVGSAHLECICICHFRDKGKYYSWTKFPDPQGT
jgi:hypothetical protein